VGSGAGIEVIIPPTRVQREAMPKNLQRLIAGLRNRVETSFKEITDQMEPARHGAHTFEGLLARTVATLVAHTLLPTLRAKQSDGNRNSHNAPQPVSPVSRPPERVVHRAGLRAGQAGSLDGGLHGLAGVAQFDALHQRPGAVDQVEQAE